MREEEVVTCSNFLEKLKAEVASCAAGGEVAGGGEGVVPSAFFSTYHECIDRLHITKSSLAHQLVTQ
jgi:hypothetical protein